MEVPAELTIPQPPAPLSRTYWVVAGQLLAGAYPGKIDPDEHLERLTGLFDSGMRTFVNLMEEDESNNAGVPVDLFRDRVERIGLADGGEQGFEDLVSVLMRAGGCTSDRVRVRIEKTFD